MKRAIHPFIFSIYPIIFLYSNNIDQTHFISVVTPLFVSILVSLLLFAFIYKFWRDAEKSAVIVSIIFILFFSYGHIHIVILKYISTLFLQEANFKKINLLSKVEIFIHICMTLAFLQIVLRTYNIIKNKRNLHTFTSFMNIVSSILLILTIVNILHYNYRTESFRKEAIEAFKDFSYYDNKPDIYYIILDGYGRSDILKEFFDFENKVFDSYLEKKGFYIAKKSYSNYAWTPLSLSSSLNFEYVNYLTDDLGESSRDLRLPYYLIESNKAIHLFRSFGYKYVHFCSTWGATLNNKYADIKIGCNRGLFRDEFIRILTETTMLKMISSFIIEDLSSIHLNTFDKLSTISENEDPTFTFSHIILPHHPFIFDRNGHVKKRVTKHDQFKSGGWNNKKEYIEQLIFVNNKIIKVVENILKKSKTEPIIIIQSDHGPQLPSSNISDFKKVRMANYMAYYFPGGGIKKLYQSITPVNTFRIILKHYFNKDYELLKDEVYFSHYGSPYNFEKLKTGNSINSKN